MFEDSSNAKHSHALVDHTYAKSSNWDEERVLRWPTKILFQKRPEYESRKSHGHHEIVDVESVDQPSSRRTLELDPKVIQGSGSGTMSECERRASVIRQPLREYSDFDWEQNVKESHRPNWSPSEDLLFRRIRAILLNENLCRLVEAGAAHIESDAHTAMYPVARRSRLEKSVAKFRRELGHHLLWEPQMAEWLNHTMLEVLPHHLLAIYLDILLTMKTQSPKMLSKLLSGIGNSRHADALAFLDKSSKSWDPVSSSMSQRPTMKYIPSSFCPIIISIASHRNQMSDTSRSKRWKAWNAQLATWGKHVQVFLDPAAFSDLATTKQFLQHLIWATASRIKDMKEQHPSKPIVLVGWNYSASLIVHLSLQLSVTALMCFGFPVATLSGKRGQEDDEAIFRLKTPTVFVMGDDALNSSPDDLEAIREKLKVKTLLIIAEECDGWLRLKKRRKEELGVTQVMADRAVLTLCGDFLYSLIAPPAAAPCPVEKRCSEVLVDAGTSAAVKGEEEGGEAEGDSSADPPVAKRKRENHSTEEKATPKKKGKIGRPTIAVADPAISLEWGGFNSPSFLPPPAKPIYPPTHKQPLPTKPEKAKKPSKPKKLPAKGSNRKENSNPPRPKGRPPTVCIPTSIGGLSSSSPLLTPPLSAASTSNVASSPSVSSASLNASPIATASNSASSVQIPPSSVLSAEGFVPLSSINPTSSTTSAVTFRSVVTPPVQSTVPPRPQHPPTVSIDPVEPPSLHHYAQRQVKANPSPGRMYGFPQAPAQGRPRGSPGRSQRPSLYPSVVRPIRGTTVLTPSPPRQTLPRSLVLSSTTITVTSRPRTITLTPSDPRRRSGENPVTPPTQTLARTPSPKNQTSSNNPLAFLSEVALEREKSRTPT